MAAWHRLRSGGGGTAPATYDGHPGAVSGATIWCCSSSHLSVIQGIPGHLHNTIGELARLAKRGGNAEHFSYALAERCDTLALPGCGPGGRVTDHDMSRIESTCCKGGVARLLPSRRHRGWITTIYGTATGQHVHGRRHTLLRTMQYVQALQYQRFAPPPALNIQRHKKTHCLPSAEPG